MVGLFNTLNTSKVKDRQLAGTDASPKSCLQNQNEHYRHVE